MINTTPLFTGMQHPDFIEFMKHIALSGPEETNHLMVAAGWAEENDFPEWSYVFRYCAGHKRRPHRKRWGQRTYWIWYPTTIKSVSYYGRASTKNSPGPRHAHLLNYIADRVKPLRVASCAEAYFVLAVALMTIQDDISIPNTTPPVIRRNVQCLNCGIIRANSIAVCPVCQHEETK